MGVYRSDPAVRLPQPGPAALLFVPPAGTYIPPPRQVNTPAHAREPWPVAASLPQKAWILDQTVDADFFFAPPVSVQFAAAYRRDRQQWPQRDVIRYRPNGGVAVSFNAASFVIQAFAPTVTASTSGAAAAAGRSRPEVAEWRTIGNRQYLLTPSQFQQAARVVAKRFIPAILGRVPSKPIVRAIVARQHIATRPPPPVESPAMLGDMQRTHDLLQTMASPDEINRDDADVMDLLNL